MAVTFYYVRHGQTMFNLRRRLQGTCDSPLTEKGISDARRAELALRKIPFDRAYCSSSERCIDTAAIVLERHNVKARPMKQLKEIDFGELDGHLIDEIQEEYDRRKMDDSFGDIGGDSEESIRKRITGTFNMIADSAMNGERVLVVSHGAFGMHTLQILFGMDIWEFQKIRRKIDPHQYMFPNCGIMKFQRRDDVWELLELPCEPERFTDSTEIVTDYPRMSHTD